MRKSRGTAHRRGKKKIIIIIIKEKAAAEVEVRGGEGGTLPKHVSLCLSPPRTSRIHLLDVSCDALIAVQRSRALQVKGEELLHLRCGTDADTSNSHVVSFSPTFGVPSSRFFFFFRDERLSNKQHKKRFFLTLSTPSSSLFFTLRAHGWGVMVIHAPSPSTSPVKTGLGWAAPMVVQVAWGSFAPTATQRFARK